MHSNKLNASGFVVYCFFLLFSCVVFAEQENNITNNGVMLHGYDPVAYFTENRPMLGWSALAYQYKGQKYYFVSKVNRQKFIANPDRYIPAYGGYCSYGVRMGKKFDIDPHAWKIYKDVLYLQLDQGTHLIWSKDIAGNVEIADKIWSSIRSTSIKQLLGD